MARTTSYTQISGSHTYSTFRGRLLHSTYLSLLLVASFALPSFLSLRGRRAGGCRRGVIHDRGGRNAYEHHMSFQLHAFLTHTHTHACTRVATGAELQERTWHLRRPLLSLAPGSQALPRRTTGGCVVTGWYMSCCIGTDAPSHSVIVKEQSRSSTGRLCLLSELSKESSDPDMSPYSQYSSF